MKATDFHTILGDLLLHQKIQRYVLFARTPITDSVDPTVHPVSSPIDQHEWQAEKHESKPYYKFLVPVYREIGAVIHTRVSRLSEPPRRFLLSCDVIYDSETSSI